MKRWRGQYDSEQGARELIASGGGLCMLWMLGMVEAGIWSEPDMPQLGDVGVVKVVTENGPEEVGAIFGGKRWHMLSPSGGFSASIRPTDISMIWRV